MLWLGVPSPVLHGQPTSRGKRLLPVEFVKENIYSLFYFFYAIRIEMSGPLARCAGNANVGVLAGVGKQLL